MKIYKISQYEVDKINAIFRFQNRKIRHLKGLALILAGGLALSTALNMALIGDKKEIGAS